MIGTMVFFGGRMDLPSLTPRSLNDYAITDGDPDADPDPGDEDLAAALGLSLASSPDPSERSTW